MDTSDRVVFNCYSLVISILPEGFNDNTQSYSMVLQHLGLDFLLEDAMEEALCNRWKYSFSDVVINIIFSHNVGGSRFLTILGEQPVTLSRCGNLNRGLSLILYAAEPIVAGYNIFIANLICCQPKNISDCTRIAKDGYPKMKSKVSSKDTYAKSATIADIHGVLVTKSHNCCLTSAFSWEMGSPSCSSRRKRCSSRTLHSGAELKEFYHRARLSSYLVPLSKALPFLLLPKRGKRLKREKREIAVLEEAKEGDSCSGSG